MTLRNVFINSQMHAVEEGAMTHPDIVALAFPDAKAETPYTVRYRKGNDVFKLLKPTHIVGISPGMHFEVEETA